MEKILKYFPNITPEQKRQLEMLGPLYEDWNAKINVISRKDISNLYEHHVLHSLAIAQEMRFRPGTRILDFGTGGGFPGIPLAILFPEASFKLIDRTAKKIRVAQEVAQAIGLRNVTAVQLSGEEEKGKFDFVVSRAVMPLPDLVRIVRKNIAREQQTHTPTASLYSRAETSRPSCDLFVVWLTGSHSASGLTRNGLRRRNWSICHSDDSCGLSITIHDHT